MGNGYVEKKIENLKKRPLKKEINSRSSIVESVGNCGAVIQISGAFL
jgi:hypothetical protein